MVVHIMTYLQCSDFFFDVHKCREKIRKQSKKKKKKKKEKKEKRKQNTYSNNFYLPLVVPYNNQKETKQNIKKL